MCTILFSHSALFLGHSNLECEFLLMFHLWKAPLCALLWTSVATELCSRTAQRGKLERRKKRKTKSLGDGKCVKKVLPPSGERQSYSRVVGIGTCSGTLDFSKGFNCKGAETGARPFPTHRLHSEPPSTSCSHSDLEHSVPLLPFLTPLCIICLRSLPVVYHMPESWQSQHRGYLVWVDRMVEHTMFIHPLVAGATLLSLLSAPTLAP